MTAGPTGGDTVLTVYRENLRVVAESDNYVAGSGYSRIADKSLGAGTYYVRVISNNGTPLSAYDLSLSTRRGTKKRK